MSQLRAQRYRVVVYERDNDHETIVMDATGNSFIAAVGTIQAGDMVGTLGDGGPRHLQHDLAQLVADQHGI